jgi:RND family efflux transporter MFP subunit
MNSYRRKRRLKPFAIAAAASWIIFGCTRSRPPAPEPTPVHVEQLSAAPDDSVLRYSAAVIPGAEVALSFKSGGYVGSIAHREDAQGRSRLLETGDAITKGEVLASVRQSDYDDKVAQAEGQMAQARAAYEKAASDFSRAVNLRASESMTQVQFDSYRAARDGDGAALKTAQAILAQAVTSREDSRIRSPFDGWVVQRSVEIGDLVGPSSASFVVADTHFVKIVFGVSDTVVQQITIGEPVTLTTESLPGSFQGRVSAVATSADTRNRLFQVEVMVPNPDNRLKAGLVATLYLGRAGGNRNVLTVPLSAIVRSTKSAGGFAVFLFDESGGKPVVHERQVELGEAVGNRIVATAGLNPGDRVVSLGASDLKEGDSVAVLQ